MNRIVRLLPMILPAAALAAACGRMTRLGSGGELLPSYHGTMRPSCAPHDAASVELRLDAVDGPEAVSFNLWPGTPVWPPTTVRFDSSHPIGMANFCVASGDCEQAEWGEVQLGEAGEGAGVSGRWTIGLADGRSRQGTFEAEWLAIQALCG
jgi:hypothetical protein